MDLPYGDPQLMWSFNRDGECDEDMRTERDTTMGLDTDAMRAEHRSAYLDLAEPRCDVSSDRKRDGRCADSKRPRVNGAASHVLRSGSSWCPRRESNPRPRD